MVQGYTQQNSGSEGGWAFLLSSRTAEEGTSSAGTTESRSYISRSYTCGASYDQWSACLPEESKLSGVEAADRETGGSMLSVTGLNQFYYLRDFTDMRCKHSRVLSIIREQLHREPNDGDVFIVMSRDRRIVRLFTYDNRSYSLFEKKFVSGYQFMKVEREGDELVYRIDWKDVVLLLEYDHYKKCYIWVLVNKAERVVIFFYEDGSCGRDVLTHFIGDAELKSVMTDGYNAYVFIGDELSAAEQSPNLKKAIHQVCMANFKAKLDKALEQAGDIHARPFLSGVDFYYKRERQYDAKGLTLEERVKRRQDLESKEMQITLRQYLKIELDKDPSETTPYLREALNYLDKFWDNIFAFLKDGDLPIDNNLAERTIRPLTMQRNAPLRQ